MRRLLCYLLSVVIALGCWVGKTPSAIAATCHTVNNQEICLESIKRSAKYHWQYRAVLKINGQTQRSKIFDCRPEIFSTPQNQSGDRPPDLANQTEKERQFVCDIVPKH